MAATSGTLDQVELQWDRRPALGVVMAAGGYQHAGRRVARLARILEAVADAAGNNFVHVGVGKDQVRRLATQFEGDLFQVASGSLDYASADLGGTGE